MDNNNNIGNNDQQPKKKSIWSSVFWVYGILIAIFLVAVLYSDNTSTLDISFTDFENCISKICVNEDSVCINKDNVKVITVYRKGNSCSVETELISKEAKEVLDSIKYKIPKDDSVKIKVRAEAPSLDKVQEKIDLWNANGLSRVSVIYTEDRDWSSTFWAWAPMILMIFIFVYLMRRMSGGGSSVFSVSKSNAEIYDKNNKSKITFKDVAGLAEVKTEVEEIVEFLKNPNKFTEIGGKIPKGALLVGPPGTGKTLLARAVAGEAGVPFFSMPGSGFVEMFVGVGASRVRDLFRQAKEKAPCIIFIDEIDAIGRARSKNPSMNANDERESTLNQLLTEMDGFGTNSGVIVLAATNRAEILDKALLRAGRFDRQIYVELPDVKDRIEIFKVHLRGVKIDDTVDLELLARQTPGFSGADIANVCNEAALIAARREKSAVQRQDFTDAVDRIIGGLEKRSKITTEEERRSIAIHEAGHATVSWHLKYASPLIKVTIVPRGKSLGAAWYLPEERQIVPSAAILDELCSLLAGRAAEELFLGRISTGAMNDLERTTKQAYAMVMYYGMSEKLPNMCYYDSTGQEYGFVKPYSEKRAELIDAEVSRIVEEQYERAKAILREYTEGHNALAETLLSREVIFTEDVEKIFGPRKWSSRQEEILAANSEGGEADEEKNNEPTPPPIPQS